ncbi:hypothetical protein [uncultured Draconibacterium sp.]|uniref:hypothetical protein n=1 Tax=uncultured Draconibacterium sp. TaxID=1573823 RepID=UPI0029C7CB05|nr:hypothetical protein [uncultured Draconibacterium sp.]
MNQEIIETTNLEKEVPQYRTWFRLHGDVIFVSVIYPSNSNRRSHFRRKTKPETNQNKKDNEMCLWHSDWQFSKIENEYGLEKSGAKTYEITVNFNEEIHRIDSVVKNIAIEFQHTLNVSINEMESRYTAHKGLGYVPYLILDFTDYSALNTILRISKFNYKKLDEYILKYKGDETFSRFLKIIRKWFTSKYFKNKSLFLDFSDCIIRLVPNGVNTIYNYEREFFIKNLLQLETVLENDEENTKKLIAKQKEEEEIELQLYLKQEKEDKIAHNKRQVLESQDYHYFRKCESNKYIREAIRNTIGQPEYVSYSFKQDSYSGYHRKIHIYRLHSAIELEPQIEIQYAVIRSYNDNEYSFLQSNIDVIKKTGENNTGIKRMSLRQKPKQRIKLVAIQNEIVKGYLHSFNDYALYTYNENEEIESKEYYVFNRKVTKTIYSELSDYFSTLGHMEVKNEDAQKVLKDIHLEDKYRHNFIEYITQNYFPEDKLEDYYNKNDEPMPFGDEELYE